MRTFIALDLFPKPREAIERFLGNLKTELPGKRISWTKNNQFHLTLDFLGNINETQQKELCQYLEEFPLPEGLQFSLHGLQVFPNWKSPRVIWLGLSPGEPLIMLKNNLDPFLEKVNIPIDKRGFIPHITLGRVKASLSRKEISILEENKNIELLKEIKFQYFTFYQSILDRSGAQHIPLIRRPFPQ